MKRKTKNTILNLLEELRDKLEYRRHKWEIAYAKSPDETMKNCLEHYIRRVAELNGMIAEVEAIPTDTEDKLSSTD